MTSQSLITVRILGREYHLRAGDDPDRVVEVAAYLDAKLREISKSSPSLPTVDVAILGALNIVDEYLKLRSVEQKNPSVSEEDFRNIHEKIRGIVDLIPE